MKLDRLGNCARCGWAPVCCICADVAGERQEELFDADELGLDPEEDDKRLYARRYGCQD